MISKGMQVQKKMKRKKVAAQKALSPEYHRKSFLLLALALFLIVFPFLSFSYSGKGLLFSLQNLFQRSTSNRTRTLPSEYPNLTILSNQTIVTPYESLNFTGLPNRSQEVQPAESSSKGKDAAGPRVAVCLVGGARSFELTGPSLLDRVVNVFNNSDLFLHSPLDKNSYKLLLLKDARQIAVVRIAEQKEVPETMEQKKVLRPGGSPNGLQGLLRYFNLVEGCLSMIDDYQTQNQIQYDWIVRTRLDGYWSAPLTKDVFIPGVYVAPPGNGYGGTNDRFGSGDRNTSRFALSRFSLIPKIFAAGYRELNSESAFRAQFAIHKIEVREPDIPFCVISERRFKYPPNHHGVPVASMGSRTPLSGSYCRPCNPACNSTCFAGLLKGMLKYWNWIYGEPELCDGSGPWEKEWEQIFDRVAGEKYAAIRKQFGSISLDKCISDLDSMKTRTGIWDAPSPSEICRVGLEKEQI